MRTGTKQSHFRTCAKIVVRDGWVDAGRVGIALGTSIFVEQWWTPVLWADEDDPTFFKTAGLKLDTRP